MAERDKRVLSFPKGISPKVNVIERVKSELGYYDVAVQRVTLYASVTPPPPYIKEEDWVR